jgi:hypothetical protein
LETLCGGFSYNDLYFEDMSSIFSLDIQLDDKVYQIAFGPSDDLNLIAVEFVRKHDIKGIPASDGSCDSSHCFQATIVKAMESRLRSVWHRNHATSKDELIHERSDLMGLELPPFSGRETQHVKYRTPSRSGTVWKNPVFFWMPFL